MLDDVIAEFVVFGLGVSLAGRVLQPEYLCDYLLAIGFVIVSN